jgi:hypothetical protein
MRFQSMYAVMVALFLVACGDDSAGTADAAPPDAPLADAPPPDAAPTIDAVPPADARPPDLSCSGMMPPDPGTIPDPLVISGKVAGIGIGGGSNLVGATVEGHKRSDDSVTATATSDMNGAYTLNIPSGGMPVDGYVHASAMGYVSGNLFPPDPTVANATIKVQLLDTSTFGLIGQFAGVNVQAGDGVFLVQVRDCAGDPAEGATVTVEGADADTVVMYAAPGNMPLPSSSQTSVSDNGLVFIFNVPAGPVTLHADYAGTAFKANPVKAFPDQTTSTLVHP